MRKIYLGQTLTTCTFLEPLIPVYSWDRRMGACVRASMRVVPREGCPVSPQGWYCLQQRLSWWRQVSTWSWLPLVCDPIHSALLQHGTGAVKRKDDRIRSAALSSSILISYLTFLELTREWKKSHLWESKSNFLLAWPVIYKAAVIKD